jgi:hypothetical protein
LNVMKLQSNFAMTEHSPHPIPMKIKWLAVLFMVNEMHKVTTVTNFQEHYGPDLFQRTEN